jgi:aminopeptidase N
MRKAIALALLVGCGGESGPTGPITARITHYDLTFDVDSRAAHAEVAMQVEVAGDCVTLPFRGADLKAETLTIDGGAARKIAFLTDSIEICGSGYDAGDEITITTDHTIPMQTLSTSQVGYSVTQDAQGNKFYYLVSWVGGCDRFGPCDNRPDQFATYTFNVTHPAGFLARCAGDITEVSATETRCDFTSDGGPTYSTFGVAVYPAWTQTPKGKWGSVDVVVYDRAQTGIEAALDNTYHSGFVSFMETNFGPYPFGSELRILTAPTYWSGFEHPGNIVLDDRLKGPSSYADPVAHVTDHEIAHQWAGDQTTLADTYDFVWKEAMAEYLSYVYEDSVNLEVGESTAKAWKSFSRGAAFFPVPAEKPQLFDYYGDVYGPGPMILFRQLEVLTSRAQVMAAIQSVLGSARSLSVDQLVAALETSTGLALAEYAAAWIHGTGAPVWPEVRATFTPAATTSTLRVEQTAALERRCKFHVAVFGANDDERIDVAVDTFTNGTDQTLAVPTPPFTVIGTVIDPLSECLVFTTPSTFAPIATPPRPHPWVSGHLAPSTTTR